MSNISYTFRSHSERRGELAWGVVEEEIQANMYIFWLRCIFQTVMEIIKFGLVQESIILKV